MEKRDDNRFLAFASNGRLRALFGKTEVPRLTRSIEERSLRCAARHLRRSEGEIKKSGCFGRDDRVWVRWLSWLLDQMYSRSLTRAGRGIRDDNPAFLFCGLNVMNEEEKMKCLAF